MTAERLRIAALAAAALAAWLGAHAYQGVAHDGVLYAFQAAARGDAALREDLFLAFGGQERWTAFPALYHAVIEALGLVAASKAAVALGHALWLGGAFWLARSVAGPVAALFALVLAAGFDAKYGAGQVFGYGEGFATPRIFAEAAVLASLGFLLRDRLAPAAAVLAAGFALHPVIGLTGAGLGFILVAAATPRLLWLAPAAMAGVALAGAAGIEPAAGLFRRFDAEWFAALEGSYLFLVRWTLADWLSLGADLIALALAARLLEGRAAALFRAAGLAALVVLGLTALGADMLRNELLTQLQPWRALWLVHALAAMGLGLAFMAATGRARLLILIFILAEALTGLSALGELAAFATGLAALGAVWLSGRAMGAALLFAAAGVLALNVLMAAQRVAGFSAVYVQFGEATGAAHWLVWLIAPLAIGVAALALAGRAAAGAGLAAALVLAGFGAAEWDRRSEWTRHAEAGGFAAPIPATGPVYWLGGGAPMTIWFGMGRTSFTSSLQGAGGVFSRDAALEHQRREALVSAFDPNTRNRLRGVNLIEPRAPTLAEVRAICADAAAPAAVVTADPVAGLEGAAWRPGAGYHVVEAAAAPDGPTVSATRVDTFHIHDCDGS